jgi:hypothetical protein
LPAGHIGSAAAESVAVISNVAGRTAGSLRIELSRYLTITADDELRVGIGEVPQPRPLTAIGDQHPAIYPGSDGIMVGVAQLLIRIDHLWPHAPGKVQAIKPITRIVNSGLSAPCLPFRDRALSRSWRRVTEGGGRLPTKFRRSGCLDSPPTLQTCGRDGENHFRHRNQSRFCLGYLSRGRRRGGISFLAKMMNVIASHNG